MCLRLLLSLALTAACTPAFAAADKNDYSDGKNWLCRPGRQDACAVDLTTTIVAADGTLTREVWKPNPTAPIDCLYVYPTVSLDPSANSDMIAGEEERRVVAMQFARFASECRLYAPLYRQATLTALRSATSANPMTPDRVMAYNDVVDAWNHYLQHDNQGRGVVLIGHSQGSSVLVELIRNEIEGKPTETKIVSAILPGTTVWVPQGKDVGGAFQYMRLCRSATQTECVIAYSSFRSTVPPPANTRFGRAREAGMIAGCVNPSAPRGGSGELRGYLSSTGLSLTGTVTTPQPWVNPAKAIDTPFVSVPGLLAAQCLVNEKGSYLEVTVHGNPRDPRTDDIVGDVLTNGEVNASWGLHAIDVDLALGNLVDVVRQQATSYLTNVGR